MREPSSTPDVLSSCIRLINVDSQVLWFLYSGQKNAQRWVTPAPLALLSLLQPDSVRWQHIVVSIALKRLPDHLNERRIGSADALLVDRALQPTCSVISWFRRPHIGRKYEQITLFVKQRQEGAGRLKIKAHRSLTLVAPDCGSKSLHYHATGRAATQYKHCSREGPEYACQLCTG